MILTTYQWAFYDTERGGDDVDTIAGYYLTECEGKSPALQKIKAYYAIINRDKLFLRLSANKI